MLPVSWISTVALIAWAAATPSEAAAATTQSTQRALTVSRVRITSIDKWCRDGKEAAYHLEFHVEDSRGDITAPTYFYTNGDQAVSSFEGAAVGEVYDLTYYYDPKDHIVMNIVHVRGKPSATRPTTNPAQVK